MDTCTLPRPSLMLALLSDLPQEWWAEDRLAKFERDHVNPAGQVWAAYRDDRARWLLYAPGSPDPKLWPHAADPYPVPPAKIFRHRSFGAEVPLNDEQQWQLAMLVAGAAGQIPHKPVQGIQWVDLAARLGRPVVYMRVG